MHELNLTDEQFTDLKILEKLKEYMFEVRFNEKALKMASKI